MNRNDKGLPLGEDGDGDAQDTLDLIDYFNDEDPCFDSVPSKAEIGNDDDDDDDSEEDERNIRNAAGPSNAFAALSLDEDD